jgi:hypothetical protein
MSNRRVRRAQDQEIQQRRERYEKVQQASILGSVISGSSGKGTGGGWGLGMPNAKPATGTQPAVNPFVIPKPAGLNLTSQTFPSNYYVEWTPATWRAACDQCTKMGYPMAYATLTSWAIQCSPFIQSLFRALESPIGKVPILAVSKNGKEYPEWTAELCNKAWQIEMRKKIAVHSHMFGFIGLNYDPLHGNVYKYPMQDIDPLNRLLRASTYDFYNGVNFSDNVNTLFVQPSTSDESFLGWLQPITRSFIQMNLTKSSWVGAGRRLAFPMMVIGYPQGDGGTDPVTGLTTNPYRLDAEAIAANADPTKAMVVPYTVDEKGNIVKAIQVDFEKPGTTSNAYAIFKDFNDSEKDEIREMILGGTLTSSVGGSGSRALGEVHADKLQSVIMDLIDFTVAYLNDEWLPKISTYYKNMPGDLQFQANKAKQLSIEDIAALADIMQKSGKRLTDQFFIANGLSPDFFEDAAPSPTPGSNAMPDNQEEETEFAAAIAGKTTPFVKKKFW